MRDSDGVKSVRNAVGAKTAQGKGSRRGWTQDELDRLTQLARKGATSAAIAREVGRSAVAVRLKASRLNLSLVETGKRSAPEGKPEEILGAPVIAPATRRKVTYLNPRGRDKDDPETRLRTAEFPPKERRGRRWKRYLASLHDEEVRDKAYAAAMRDIGKNLEREIWDILHEHQRRFLHDVAHEFVRSIAEEVRERDRQYKEFYRTLELTRDADTSESPVGRDPLEELLRKETKELNEWQLAVHNRIIDLLDESLIWYYSIRPSLSLKSDAARLFLTERDGESRISA